MRLKFEDMCELRRRVVELVNQEKVRVKWEHIRPSHDVRRHEIFMALRYGTLLKPDKEVEGRYVTWSSLTEDGRVIRVVFEVQKIDGELVVVVTAFREE
jgi:methionine-rich copper-binding protein CopC